MLTAPSHRSAKCPSACAEPAITPLGLEVHRAAAQLFLPTASVGRSSLSSLEGRKREGKGDKRK